MPSKKRGLHFVLPASGLCRQKSVRSMGLSFFLPLGSASGRFDGLANQQLFGAYAAAIRAPIPV